MAVDVRRYALDVLRNAQNSRATIFKKRANSQREFQGSDFSMLAFSVQKNGRYS